MADFKVNIDALQDAIDGYNNAKDEMTRIKDAIDRCIDVLNKGDWDSDAGDKFVETYNAGWADSVDKYNAVIELMVQLLGTAQTEYTTVIEAADKLEF